MVDKLILLESLGFLLAPEVRSHVSFPSLFKNTKIDFFSAHLFRESTDMTTLWQITQVSGLFFWQALISLLQRLKSVLRVALGAYLVELHILQSLSTEICLSVLSPCAKETGTSA